jgi:soluble lytic murein transglycosylase-like protein
MACVARPLRTYGRLVAVLGLGLASTAVRAESGEGARVLLGGAMALQAPEPPLGGALPAILDLPPSVGPMARVPLPRVRPADEAAEAAGSASGAVLPVAVPLPRERPTLSEALSIDEAETPAPRTGADAALPVFATGPAGIRGLIARHAQANGIPVTLADAVVRVESRYNPHARNGANIGLMQISLPTARSLGYGGSAAGLADAETNLTYGVRYLAQAYRLADGDTCRTVLKFQGGHRALTMTPSARKYCAQVQLLAAQFR